MTATVQAAVVAQPKPSRPSLRDYLERALPSARIETIDRMIDTARRRDVHSGEFIYRQGEPVPLTLIVEGYGAARRTTSGGKELVSGVAQAGVLFGWSGLASVPSSVELVALTECKIGQWPGDEVRALAAADPGLALGAIDSMAWSLHQTVERIEGFLHQDARLRVLRVLAQYRTLFFDEPPVLDEDASAWAGRHQPRDDRTRPAPAGARGDDRARRPRRPPTAPA